MRVFFTAVCLALLGCVVGCSGGSGGSLAYDPADPPGPVNTYTLPTHFSSTQGYKGWSYYLVPSGGDTYEALTWGDAPAGTPYNIAECWQGAGASPVLISRDRLCPAAGQDAVIRWSVPRTGQVELSVTLESLTTEASGDGVAVSIRRNGTTLVEPTLIANVQGQQHTLSAMHTMQSGDQVYLRVDPRENAAGDWLKYGVTVKIQ
jgi:hypothetical protein